MRRFVPLVALALVIPSGVSCGGSSDALRITDAPLRLVNARQVPVDIWIDGFREGNDRAPGTALNLMLTPGTHQFEIRSADGMTVLDTTTWDLVARIPRNLMILNTGFLKDVPGAAPTTTQIGLRAINATPDATVTIEVRNATATVQNFSNITVGAPPSEVLGTAADLQGRLFINGGSPHVFETALQVVNNRETRTYVAYKRADGTYGLLGFIDMPL